MGTAELKSRCLLLEQLTLPACFSRAPPTPRRYQKVRSTYSTKSCARSCHPCSQTRGRRKRMPVIPSKSLKCARYPAKGFMWTTDLIPLQFYEVGSTLISILQIQKHRKHKLAAPNHKPGKPQAQAVWPQYFRLLTINDLACLSPNKAKCKCPLSESVWREERGHFKFRLGREVGVRDSLQRRGYSGQVWGSARS